MQQRSIYVKLASHFSDEVSELKGATPVHANLWLLFSALILQIGKLHPNKLTASGIWGDSVI